MNRDLSADITKTFAICPHGNLPDSCEVCRSENKQTVPKATKKFRSHNDPNRRELEDQTIDKPYIIEHKLGQQRLVFFGTAHTSDIESPFISGLRTQRAKFLKNVPPEKVVFMVEGMSDGMDIQKANEMLVGIENEDEAIKKFGETGALMWTAKEQGIEITSPEIPENQIVQELKNQGFNQEEIALTFLLRDITSSVGRMPDNPRDEAFRQESLKNFAREFFYLQNLTGITWIKDLKKGEDLAEIAKDPKKLREYMQSVIEEALQGANKAFSKMSGMSDKKLIPSLDALLNRDKQQIPIEDVNALYDPLDEKGLNAITNQIASAYNLARDKYLTTKVFETLKDGKSPFIVYGASHAITIEPALEETASQFK